jgi:hypothetical protein
MPAIREVTGRFAVPITTGASSSASSSTAEPFQEPYWSPDPNSPQRQEAFARAQRKASLLATILRVRALERRPEGWNGYDALPPDHAAVVYAEAWLREAFREFESAGLPWFTPYVTSSAEGEVVLQWWNEPRKLTLYFSAHEATYIKSWGPDMVTEMEDGDAASATSRKELWMWLTS